MSTTPTVLAQANDIAWACFAKRAPAFSLRGKRRPTAAQAAGLRFERHVLEYLSDQYCGFFLPRPWFMYMLENESDVRWCQPDGILFQPRSGVVTIVEVKIRHTNAAWQKLDGLYKNVVQTLFPASLWQVALCELTRVFDCAVVCQAQPRLIDSVVEARPGEFAVMTWKPQH